MALFGLRLVVQVSQVIKGDAYVLLTAGVITGPLVEVLDQPESWERLPAEEPRQGTLAAAKVLSRFRLSNPVSGRFVWRDVAAYLLQGEGQGSFGGRNVTAEFLVYPAPPRRPLSACHGHDLQPPSFFRVRAGPAIVHQSNGVGLLAKSRASVLELDFHSLTGVD
jgi:hypothetical protein